MSVVLPESMLPATSTRCGSVGRLENAPFTEERSLRAGPMTVLGTTVVCADF